MKSAADGLPLRVAVNSVPLNAIRIFMFVAFKLSRSLPQAVERANARRAAACGGKLNSGALRPCTGHCIVAKQPTEQSAPTYLRTSSGPREGLFCRIGQNQRISANRRDRRA